MAVEPEGAVGVTGPDLSHPWELPNFPVEPSDLLAWLDLSDLLHVSDLSDESDVRSLCVRKSSLDIIGGD